MQYGNTTVVGTLVHSSTGATQIAQGTAAQRPTASKGGLRYNTDTNLLEFGQGSTPAWLTIGSGTVSNVTVAAGTVGLSVVNPTVTSAGTITVSLGQELVGLTNNATSGVITRTAAGTYTGRTVTAAATTALTGLSVTNGEGIAGNPTIGLNLAGISTGSSYGTNDFFILSSGGTNTKVTVNNLVAFLKSSNNNNYFTTGYQNTFGNSSLTAGKFVCTHSLGLQYNTVTIYDNTGNVVQPDAIVATSTSVTTIDLTSYGTITGTWQIMITGVTQYNNA